MPQPQPPEQLFEALKEEYPQYDPKAYSFVLMALQKVSTGLEERRHLHASELAEGVLELAHEEFGPLAAEVMQNWGLETTEDIGQIVFALVEKGVMKAREEDRREDFENLFALSERLEEEYEIGQALQQSGESSSPKR